MAYPVAYNPYMNSYGQQYTQYPQYPQMQQTASYVSSQGIVWVDGETEAKGKQIPAGAAQFAMWDINEPIIYIKSVSPMGIPNPLRKIRYHVEDMPTNAVGSGNTANLMSGEEEKDGSAHFVSKDELQSMKDEIMQAIREIKPESSGTARKTTVRGE